MANTKLNILNQPKHLLLIVSLVMAVFVFLHAPRAHAAACPTPTTDMGSVTSTINVVQAGTYRVWSRMTNGTSTTTPIDNSYSLEIDGANCFVVGDASTALPTTFNNDSTNWVNYQNGSTSTPIDVALSTGSHTIKMIGREDGVKVDRVGFTTDTTCIPTGTGDNCFTAADTTAPTAAITSPAANAKVAGTVNVTSTATDDSGLINKVEFYVDGVMVGTADTTAPYSFSWNTTSATNGTHSLTVKAYDPSGNIGTSAAVSVTVDNAAPTVSLTAPTNGSTLTGTVTVSANASDVGTGVASVQFYYGSTLIASDTTSPYSTSWDTTAVANGTYSLTAKATDGAGNVTTSTAISVTLNNTVTPPDTTAPTSSITLPVSGSTLLFGNNTVNVSAADNVGVTRVELYVDGALSATDTSAPYSYTLSTTNLTNGNHTLVAKAYDAAGNIGTSSAVTVTVNSSFTNPGDVNGDGHDTIIDLSTLLTNYGTAGTKVRTQGDLNNDGLVNITDLSILLTNYGS